MSSIEKRVLQGVVAVGCLVPIIAGAAGMVLGPRMVGGAAIGSGDLDSHFRYLSGLLLGIGLAYASTVPQIEKRGGRFWLLTGIVLVGGLGRLMSLAAIGAPSSSMAAAFVMELLVTPGLALWQHRIARQARPSGLARTTGLAPN